METRRGIAVSPGVAIGPAFVLESEGARIARRFVMPEETEQEVVRFEKALKGAHGEITALAEKLREKIEDFDSVTDIFQIHLRILEDPKLHEEVTNLIRHRHFTPEYAVSRAVQRYVKSLENAGDSYLRQRVRDFDDLEQRLLGTLLGEQREDLAHLKEPVLVIARDLTPSQTVSFDRTRVLAIATEAGGRTSHTAILARALRMPAVVGVSDLSTSVSGGDTVIVDGTRGVVIVDPDEVTLRRFRTRQRSLEVIEEKINAEFCNLPAVTRDGRKVSIEANIEFPEEVHEVLRHGAEGVGLYRTEFLYHTRDEPPGEEDHFDAYMGAIRSLGDHRMTIRVLDLGADKFPMGFDERNPFLGCRSMRLMGSNPEMFRRQLRAILRASVMGNVRFMFPMISSRAELLQARQLVTEVMADLDRSGTPYKKDVQIGMMIEVPSAAILADTFAKEVDFFSIGTNDLVQYTLAVDRDNEHVAHLFSPVDPAVLRLIKLTVEAGERAGIEVGLCGEMAGDILYAILLVGLGLRHLSMAPTAVVDVKKLICSITYKEAKKVADTVMTMLSVEEIEGFLREVTRRSVPELLEDEAESEASATA